MGRVSDKSVAFDDDEDGEFTFDGQSSMPLVSTDDSDDSEIDRLPVTVDQHPTPTDQQADVGNNIYSWKEWDRRCSIADRQASKPLITELTATSSSSKPVPKLSNAHFQKDCGVVKSQRSPTIGESL